MTYKADEKYIRRPKNNLPAGCKSSFKICLLHLPLKCHVDEFLSLSVDHHVLNRRTRASIAALISLSLCTYSVFSFDIHRKFTKILKSMVVVCTLGYQFLGEKSVELMPII